MPSAIEGGSYSPYRFSNGTVLRLLSDPVDYSVSPINTCRAAANSFSFSLLTFG